MRAKLQSVVVLGLMLAAGTLAITPAATAASPDWPDSTAAAFNLGGTVNGQYVDFSGGVFTGNGQIVVDVDGAFTAGNPAFVTATGASKIAGEACIGQEKGTTPFPTLCDTTTVVTSSAPGNDPMYFSMLAGSSRPSNAPTNSCVDSGDFCHNFHGTATAGAIVGQPGVRYEGTDALRTAGAAVGARVFQIKIGGGDSTTGRIGWPHESVVDALYWINKVLSETSGYKGKIAAVNLSVSGGTLSESALCGADGMKVDAAAALLKAKGIAVVMAAGNDGIHGRGTWNCGPNIVRVGATNIATPNTLTSYTNRGSSVVLHAPVGDANRAQENILLLPWKSSGTFYVSGTSFASPQVAGAYAVLRQKFGYTPTVDQLTALLQSTGTPVTGTNAAADAVDVNIKAALNGTP